MRSYLNWLSEKFTEDSDPISDMGIGRYQKHLDFKSISQCSNFLIEIMPKILGTPSIPDDVLTGGEYFLKQQYINKIYKYCEKYITVNGNDYWWYLGDVWKSIRAKLLKKGFKPDVKLRYDRFVKESLLEKFVEDSDPIYDMGIGLISKVKKWVVDAHADGVFKKSDSSSDPIPFKNVIINNDLTISVLRGRLDISDDKYITLPEYIKFNYIENDFSCILDQKKYKKHFPKEVGGEVRFYYRYPLKLEEENIRKICNVHERVKFILASY